MPKQADNDVAHYWYQLPIRTDYPSLVAIFSNDIIDTFGSCMRAAFDSLRFLPHNKAKAALAGGFQLRPAMALAGCWLRDKYKRTLTLLQAMQESLLMGIFSQLFGPPLEIRKSRSLEEMLQARPSVLPRTPDDFEAMLDRALDRWGEKYLRGRQIAPAPVTVARPKPVTAKKPSVTKSAPAKRRLKLCPVCHEKELTGKQRTCSDRCRQAQSRAKRAKPKAKKTNLK